jgi:glyoxylate reductase
MPLGAGNLTRIVMGSRMRPRVYVTQPIAESALLRLKEIAEVEVNPDSSRIPVKDKLIDAAKRSDILLCLLHDTIDRDVLAANPNLKAIASMTITPDRIDVDEATSRKIIVTNIPAVVTDATADIAFGLLIAVARRIVEGDRVRSGVFPGSQSNHLAGTGVSGKTLGIVGMGRIGQAMARRARGFDMTVLYSDPRALPAEEEEKLGVRLVSFEELLGQSDFISLHPALNDETRHMIGARQFALMKRSAFLINTSRGSVVDDRARAADHGQCGAHPASRQRGDGAARTHGACGGRQYRRDRGRPPAAELHQSVGVRAGGVGSPEPREGINSSVIASEAKQSIRQT